MTYAHLAVIGYEANRAYAAALGERRPPAWHEAEPLDRRLWYLAAQHHVHHPAASLPALHDYWLSLESMAGWSYGPVLDNDARQHPHHVPWDRLPEPQRRKVAMFRDVVRTLAYPL